MSETVLRRSRIRKRSFGWECLTPMAIAYYYDTWDEAVSFGNVAAAAAQSSDAAVADFKSRLDADVQKRKQRKWWQW